jgi:hypothetical protein
MKPAPTLLCDPEAISRNPGSLILSAANLT